MENSFDKNSISIHAHLFLSTHKDLSICLWIQPLSQSVQQESNDFNLYVNYRRLAVPQ